MAIMNGGKILQQSTPTSATKNIDGCIWKKSIQREKLTQMEESYQVLSSSYNEDNSLEVRVYSEENLDNSFEMANPNLEDVYFIALEQSNH